jgi:DNA-binding MarR family transcriptional regulator
MSGREPHTKSAKAAAAGVASGKITVDRLRHGLLPLVMQAYFHTRRTFDDAMRIHGVTTSQAGMLSRIYSEPGISGAELSRQMLTTPQAVQLMLTTLERKGLIIREPDPTQGRVVGARLTDAGREVFVGCVADATEADRRLGQGLSSEERSTLMELLERYIHSTGPASELLSAGARRGAKAKA